MAAACAFAAAGDHAAALKCLLVLAPSVAGRLVRVPPAFDLLFTAALAGDAAGSGLAADVWPDDASHLILPFLSAPIVYRVLLALGAAPPPAATRRAAVGAGIATAVGVLALGALWELVEWGSDVAFGTDYSQGYWDTLSDLLLDAIAAVLGGALVAVWLARAARQRRGRRLAGERRSDYRAAA